MLAELRRVAGLIDDAALRRDAFDVLSRITSGALVDRFGSWRQALEAAGLGDRYRGPVVSVAMRRKPARRLSEAQLLARLRRAARRDGVVTQTMLRRSASMCAQSYARRFGSWAEAVRKAGLRLSIQGEKVERIAALAAEERCDGSTAATRDKAENRQARGRDAPLYLRYAILRRDDYRCRLCGDSPAISRGTTLEVDHIQPFSQGGKTTEANLQTLCRRCNQGKGARA